MKKPNVAYRALRYLKNHGLKETIERAKQGNEPAVPPKNNVIGFYRFVVDNDPIPFNQKEYEKHKNDKKKILNWVVPEMGPGSGGHTTIFRFISNLERLGFHSRVYLYMSPNFQDNASIRKFLKEYFPLLVPEVEVYCDVSQMKFAHATVATSWTTAYYVRNSRIRFRSFTSYRISSRISMHTVRSMSLQRTRTRWDSEESQQETGCGIS